MKIIFALLLFASLGFAQQTANEKAAWQGEESYWRALKANDKPAFMALWSDRFKGWPATEPVPGDKARIAERFGLRSGSSYKLTPLSVREYGKDIVITFYRAEYAREGKTTTSRITHTWMRNGDTWQIIGGMSANDDGTIRK